MTTFCTCETCQEIKMGKLYRETLDVIYGLKPPNGDEMDATPEIIGQCNEAPPTAPKNNLQEGKPRPSLLPLDIMLEFEVSAYEEGCIKYERDSWRRGFNTTTLIDAALRHITAFMSGEDWDPDAQKLGIKKHHLAGAIWCLRSILWTLKTRPELDDR